MTKPRKKIPDRTKLAATLCRMLRPNEAGGFEPAIDYETSKKLSVDEILSLFHFDHDPVAVSMGGTDAHYNLAPRFIMEHRKKTAEVDVPAAAKSNRLSEEQENFRRRMLAKAGQGWSYQVKEKKGAVMPGSRKSRFKKKINGRVEIRK